MHTEIEAKWLAINPAEVRQVLEQVGAILTSPERSMMLVLDFTKIDPSTPGNENFEKLFQEYSKKGLDPRMPDMALFRRAPRR